MNTSSLSIGSTGAGILDISGGGLVTASSVAIGTSTSLLAIDVGRGSSAVVGGGSGTITNSGAVRLLAGAGVAAGGAYSPVSAGTWSGSGTYQAVGGTWNATSHQFTVSQVAAGAAGTPVTIDQSQEQRILITDPVSGKSVGASFLATTSSSTLSLTASLLSRQQFHVA